MSSIPASVADIDAAWLRAVLAGSFAGEVTGVRADNLGAGLGLLGEVTRLHLDWSPAGAGPSTLIAKTQSPAPESAFVAQLMGFYHREVSFYRELAGRIEVHTPRCYHADISDDGASFVLLLDDITGARAIDQITGATRADAETVVDQAVVLHARFWDSPELWALDWLPPINTPLFLAAADLAAAKLPRYLEYWDGKAPAAAVAFVRDMTPHYPALLDWWVAQGHPTFAHMDYRADNFLFGGSPGADVVTVLDWQLSVRGVGVWDIANFLAGSVTVENRRAWEHDLVRRYHEGLLAAGVTGYDWDRCWRDYRYAIGQQAWSTCPMGDMDPGNERGQLLLDTITPRYLIAADDHGVNEMLDLF
ncbi:MAG TPA: phosphotransferase [Acidimicrobiales bacterium]|nr:phosphotransferase [Acidimicrobiales bacterium]